MIRLVINNLVRLLVLILLQNFLNLIPFTALNVSPSFFIIAIMLFPFETPGWLSLLAAFFLGVLIDWPMDSIGQHAFACVFLAGVRPLILDFIAERNEYVKGTYPRMVYFGTPWAMKYSVSMVFAYSLVFYSIESFSFSSIGIVIGKIVLNTILTSLLIILSQYWVFKKVA